MSKISMDNNIAVMNVQYLQYSFDYFIDSMCQCGIKNVDFWAGFPHYSRLNHYSSLSAERSLQRIRKSLDDRNLKVIMYTPELLIYPYSFSSPQRSVREKTIEYLDQAMDDALILGTNTLFINSGCALRDFPKEDSWKRTVDSIHKVLEKAKKKGIRVVIEQLQPYESNLITTKKDLIKLLNEIESDNLKICLDLIAMEVTKEKITDYFPDLKQEIKHIHFSDGDPSGHFVLGDGDLPLKKYIEILEQNNYQEYITLEINDSIYWEDPHSSIERSVEYLKNELNITV